MRRLIFRIFLTLLALLLVTAIAGRVILNTDLPRRLVIATLSKELGMKVTASSLQTSLTGETTITDFTISLPMEETPLLVIPEIKISHTALYLIPFKRSLTLHSTRILNPVINITENEKGLWNIREFAYRLQKDATDEQKNNKPKLPQLNIIDGLTVVTDSTGQTENISPISFQGLSNEQPLWNFELNIASQIMASGRIAQGSDWSHEVEININDLPDILRNLIPYGSESLSLNTRWKGRVIENKLSGKLQLERVQLGEIQTNGILGIEISTSGLLVNFDDLLLQGLNFYNEEIRVLDGSIKFDGNQLQADRILIDTAQTNASLTGRWNMIEQAGNFNAFMAGVIPERNIDFQSTLQATINSPQIGQKHINLSITTQGKSSWGSWQNQADILGSGKTWSNSQWQVNIPLLVLQLPDIDITSSDIRADITADWPDIRLINLSSANTEQLKAQGEFSTDTNNWEISFEAQDLKANDRQNSPLDLTLIARGDLTDIAIEELRIDYKDLQFETAGNVALPSSGLSNVSAKLSLIIRPTLEDMKSFAHISGNMECETSITGTLWPTNLQLQAVLSGQDITMNKKIIEPIKIPWQAEIDTSKVEYNTDQFRLFDGLWNLNGSYEFSQQSTQLTLNADQVSLQPVIQLFDLPIESNGLMTANLEVKLPANDIDQMAISGIWNVRNLVISPFEADSAEGRISIRNGTAVFDQIRLRENQALASAGARFRLDQPQYVSVEIQAQQWPLRFTDKNMTFLTDAEGTATLNLANRTMMGKGRVSTSLAVDDKKLADFSADLAVEKRTLDLNQIKIETLGGQANGIATIPLDNLIDSRVSIEWQDMNMAELPLYLSKLEDLGGKASGSLTVAKAQGPRPFEPLQIEISGRLSEGNFRIADIGRYRLSAYLGNQRLLIDQAELDMMNGTIKSSGSLSRVAGGYSTYLNTDFSLLELNQLVHIFLPNAEPVLGRLTGKGMLVVFSDLRGLTGEVNIQLSESDLASTMLVSTMYDTMNLKFGNNEPAGQGQIKLRFEGSSLHIPSFVYFNRGVEIRGRASIDDFTKGKASPVSGYAIGSARPLRGNTLPGIDHLDRLMASLQTNVSSVKIQGTLDEPEVAVVPFQEISSGLRSLLWGQLFDTGKNGTD
ncbi:hypothetical protein ACFLZ8_02570 [Planctomycetota bacterium]